MNKMYGRFCHKKNLLHIRLDICDMQSRYPSGVDNLASGYRIIDSKNYF